MPRNLDAGSQYYSSGKRVEQQPPPEGIGQNYAAGFLQGNVKEPLEYAMNKLAQAPSKVKEKAALLKQVLSSKNPASAIPLILALQGVNKPKEEEYVPEFDPYKMTGTEPAEKFGSREGMSQFAGRHTPLAAWGAKEGVKAGANLAVKAADKLAPLTNTILDTIASRFKKSGGAHQPSSIPPSPKSPSGVTNHPRLPAPAPQLLLEGPDKERDFPFGRDLTPTNQYAHPSYGNVDPTNPYQQSFESEGKSEFSKHSPYLPPFLRGERAGAEAGSKGATQVPQVDKTSDKFAQDFATALSGNKKLGEQGKEVAAEINKAHIGQVSESKKKYDPIFTNEKVAENKVNAKEYKKLYKDSKVKFTEGTPLYKMHINFKDKKDLDSLHKFQQEMGGEIGWYNKKEKLGTITAEERMERSRLVNYREALKRDGENHIKKYAPELEGKYKEAGEWWEKNVLPYRKDKDVYAMARGDIKNPGSTVIKASFANPEEKDMLKVMNDLTPEARKRVLSIAMGKTSDEYDAKNILSGRTALEKQGFYDYVTPEHEQEFNKIAAQTKAEEQKALELKQQKSMTTKQKALQTEEGKRQALIKELRTQEKLFKTERGRRAGERRGREEAAVTEGRQNIKESQKRIDDLKTALKAQQKEIDTIKAKRAIELQKEQTKAGKLEEKTRIGAIKAAAKAEQEKKDFANKVIKTVVGATLGKMTGGGIPAEVLGVILSQGAKNL